MPHLRRVVYTTAALDSLFAEERRCPRCGGMLHAERRTDNRRTIERRRNRADVPGPRQLRATAAERRRDKRRRDDTAAF
jgi:hypothetical protein